MTAERTPPLVLVVEDSRDMRETLVVLLGDEGYRTVSAVDGLDALDVAEREQPDVILVDHGMPRLDGPGFCRAYRERGGTATIVLITAALRVGVAEAAVDAEACGASAFIAKPFKIDELLEQIARCLPSPM